MQGATLWVSFIFNDNTLLLALIELRDDDNISKNEKYFLSHNEIITHFKYQKYWNTRWKFQENFILFTVSYHNVRIEKFIFVQDTPNWNPVRYAMVFGYNKV